MNFTQFKKVYDYIGDEQIIYLIEQKGKRITEKHKKLCFAIKSFPNISFIEINTSLNDTLTLFSVGEKKGNSIMITKHNLMPILKSLGLTLEGLVEDKVVLKKYKHTIDKQYCNKKGVVKRKTENIEKGITTKIANAKNNKLSDNIRIWASKTKESLDKNATKSEQKMNFFLKKYLKLGFQKNHPFRIKGKQFFADFYIKSANAIIEVDGGYHDTDEQREKDKMRDSCFKSIGIKTYRIKNEDVYNDSPIMNKIFKGIKKRQTLVSKDKKKSLKSSIYTK